MTKYIELELNQNVAHWFKHEMKLDCFKKTAFTSQDSYLPTDGGHFVQLQELDQLLYLTRRRPADVAAIAVTSRGPWACSCTPDTEVCVYTVCSYH